ncbi:MAG TPA: DUF697 domain-containing protein [Thermoanaerobaculia bacterium]|nr:DUF697 domain-containing protein [Thermoanaerobaculia bacterium]
MTDVPATSDAPYTEHPAPALLPQARLDRNHTLVREHMLLAMVAGLIPSPGLDLVAVVALQLALVARLANVYEREFSEDAGKAVLWSLLGGAGATSLGAALALSGIKTVPLLGTIVGVLGMPLLLGAYTYAVGKVFIAHFESGGTLLDFNAARYRTYWGDMFRHGVHEARTMMPQARQAAGDHTAEPQSDISRVAHNAAAKVRDAAARVQAKAAKTAPK